MQERHRVPDRLRREPTCQESARESLDLLRGRGVDPALPESGRDVDALHRLAALPVRQPHPLDGEATAQGFGGLVDRSAALLRPGRRPGALRLDEHPGGAPGLGTGQAIGLARAHLAQAAVGVAPIRSYASGRNRRLTWRRDDRTRESVAWTSRRRGAQSLASSWSPTPSGPLDQERQKPCVNRALPSSGRQDLNLRPPGPQPERSRPVGSRLGLGVYSDSRRGGTDGDDLGAKA